MPINEYGQPIGDPVPWTPAAPPPGAVLTGAHVRLEPLSPDHLADLFDALNQPSHEKDWTYLAAGPFTSRPPFDEFMLTTDGMLRYAVLVDGRAEGTASYLRIQPEVGSIELGWVHYGPRLRGTPAATESFALFAQHVFELGYRRYEWKCDVLNERSRRAAERLGFSYEGTWRSAQVYKGRNRDTAWYAMTDEDWAARDVIPAGRSSSQAV